MSATLVEQDTFLCADLLCGAGGFSVGARRAIEGLGKRVKLVAVNHWPIAIETHRKNHPDCEHYLVDVFKTRPRDAVPGGYLDLLMASPTCTFNSRARGGKPISRDQRYGRMTPTQVIRWITELEVKVLLVENVPEFVDWGPVHQYPPEKGSLCAKEGRCKEGLPCKRKKGHYFRPWVRRIEALGYAVEYRVLNAADYGDATTRKRLFLIARKDGEPISWPQQTHSKQGGLDLFGNVLAKWRGAKEIIDYTLPSQSIYTRKKKLAKPTRGRIRSGLVKFKWAPEYLQTLDAYEAGKPLPLFFKPTRAAGSTPAAVAPEPFIATSRKHDTGRSTDQPIPTHSAGGTHVGLASAAPKPAIVFPLNQGKERARGLQSPDDPVCTITATGTDLGLAEGKPFLVANRTNNAPKSTDDPMATATTTTGGGNLFVSSSLSFVLSQGAGGAPRSTNDPLPTAPAAAAHELVEPFISSFYGHGGSHPVGAPLPTQSTKDRFALVFPVTHHGSMRTRSGEEPLPTLTGAQRGELAVAEGFITASFGERPGQAPRVHDPALPVPAITASGHTNLVTGSFEPIDGEVLVDGVWGVWVFYDIHLRMLQPAELSRAHSFEDEEFRYEFVGNKTEVCRQIGNSVPVRTSKALVLSQIVPLDLAEAA